MDKPLLEGSGSGHHNREAIPVDDLIMGSNLDSCIIDFNRDTNANVVKPTFDPFSKISQQRT